MTDNKRLFFTCERGLARCLMIAIRNRVPNRHAAIDGDGLVFYRGAKSFRVGFTIRTRAGLSKPLNGDFQIIFVSGVRPPDYAIRAGAVVILHRAGGQYDTSQRDYDEAAEQAAQAVRQFYGEPAVHSPKGTPSPATGTTWRLIQQRFTNRPFKRWFGRGRK